MQGGGVAVQGGVGASRGAADERRRLEAELREIGASPPPQPMLDGSVSMGSVTLGSARSAAGGRTGGMALDGGAPYALGGGGGAAQPSGTLFMAPTADAPTTPGGATTTS
eukprot:6881058-Prymnesium_polylepis.1